MLNGGGPDAAEPISALPDASAPAPDARPRPDAGPVSIPDAAAPPPDADLGGGLVCTDNSQCTAAGTCCFSVGGPGFCVPGTEVGGLCVPE